MSDLEQIKEFRAHVAAPERERVARARARLVAEFHAETEPQTSRMLRPGIQALRARRVALPLGLGTTAAVAVASGLVLFGNGRTTSTADAAVIHRAAAALAAPANEIFHYKLEGENGFVAESWQLTSAPYASLAGRGPVGSIGYVSDDGTTVSQYDPTTNTITQHPSNKPPTPAGPLSEIKQELQDGQARVLGTSTIDGTSTYKIQLADNNGSDAQGIIAYVDQASYRPIMLAYDPQHNGTIVDLNVVTFEYLPATPANQNLLSLTDRYPSAQVVADNTTPPDTTTGSK